MSSSSTTVAIKSCLDVLRRTDPRDAKKHLTRLASLISDDDVVDELYQRVDVPLEVGEDSEANGRKFLLCEHNRDGDSHRSPWSNSYFPPLPDDDAGGGGLRPSDRLRSLELQFNEAFDVYRTLYYGKEASSVGSVYLWDKDGGEDDDDGFAGCFLVRNRIDDGNDWNSVHVLDVGRKTPKGTRTYKLTTTVMLTVTPPSSEAGSSSSSSSTTRISGSLVRHNERECKVDESNEDGAGASHVVNVGRFIEDVEGEMRSEMDSLYVQKTRTVVEMIRKECPRKMTMGQEHTKVLNEAVLAMAMSKKAGIR